MDLKNISNKLISTLFIFTIFDVYSFLSIRDFEITTGIFIMIVVYLLKIIDIRSYIVEFNFTNIMAYIMIVYCMLNFLFQGGQATSLIYISFFLIFLILSYREIDEDEFQNIVNKYIYITSIVALYAIYQSFARTYGWSFAELYFEPIMQHGYNWTNSIYLGGVLFWRSNGIYKEPSFLSQYTALAICFLHIKFWKEKKKIYLVLMIIDIIAIILSFSGTGILVLFTFAIYRSFYWIKFNRSKLKAIKCISILSIITFGVVFLQNNIYVQYFYSRISEISTNSASGGMRFIGPFIALKESLKNNFFMGVGVGRRIDFVENLSLGFNTLTSQSTLARIGIDLGIFGMLFFIIILVSLFLFDKKKNLYNEYYTTILIFCFIQLFNGEYFLSVTYWAFIYFINVTIKKRNT